ncbi:MAG: DUF167 domain-containing protein [Candidatus Lutacidiplasmatales archaeon]
MARIALWVKPGSRVESLEWDPWRSRWVVCCREPPTGGKANRAVAEMMAGWLNLPGSSVRWAKSGSSRAKILAAEGISDDEAARRLRARLTGTGARASSSEPGSSVQRTL